ncbi:MAG: glycosyltransferase [Candidatus Korobacteraceae bacterium]
MVSVTIVTWNSERYLDECFAALDRQDYRNLEVIIVDNASEDETSKLLQRVESKWRVIYNDKNVGFAAGQNRAIRASRGEYVLCLNPDVVLSPDFVTQLVAAAEAHSDAGSFCGKLLRWDPMPEAPSKSMGSALKGHGFQPCRKAAQVAPLGAEGELPQGLKPGSLARFDGTPEGVPLQKCEPEGSLYLGVQGAQEGSLYPDLNGTSEVLQNPAPEGGMGADPRKTNIIDSTGIYFTPNMRHLDRGAEEIDHGQYDRMQYVFGASGAAAFFRRNFIEAVSVEGEFFDEDFFAFREDGDLAWRAQVMGWKCLYVPAAVAWHVRRVTPERRKELPLVINWHSAKNRFLMRGKNASGWLCWRLFFPVLWRDIMTFGYAAVRDRRLWSAVIYWWKARASIRRKRAIIQSRRRVSDRDLLWWFSNRPRALDVQSGEHSAVSNQHSASEE